MNIDIEHIIVPDLCEIMTRIGFNDITSGYCFSCVSILNWWMTGFLPVFFIKK